MIPLLESSTLAQSFHDTTPFISKGWQESFGKLIIDAECIYIYIVDKKREFFAGKRIATPKKEAVCCSRIVVRPKDYNTIHADKRTFGG